MFNENDNARFALQLQAPRFMSSNLATRYYGRISNWKDDKGFGFITPNGGGDKAFLHIKAFRPNQRRPMDDDAVSYVVTRDANGRAQASDIQFDGVPAPARRAKSGQLMPMAALGVLVLLMGVGMSEGLASIKFALVYAGVSLATFVAYLHDKSAAQSGRWRTKESTLHLMALLCGWPGALLAQKLLRHKSSKPGFQSVFWLTVLCNCSALIYLLFFADAWLRM